jgi:hypothetical protein
MAAVLNALRALTAPAVPAVPPAAPPARGAGRRRWAVAPVEEAEVVEVSDEEGAGAGGSKASLTRESESASVSDLRESVRESV